LDSMRRTLRKEAGEDAVGGCERSVSGIENFGGGKEDFLEK
jgi:hypothetical protein